MATKRYTPKEFIQPVAKRWKKLKKTPLKLGKPRDFQSPAAELRFLLNSAYLRLPIDLPDISLNKCRPLRVLQLYRTATLLRRRLIGELQTGDLASFREMWKVYFYRELHRPLRSLLALRGCLGTVDVVSAPGFNEDSKFVRDPPPPPPPPPPLPPTSPPPQQEEYIPEFPPFDPEGGFDDIVNEFMQQHHFEISGAIGLA